MAAPTTLLPLEGTILEQPRFSPRKQWSAIGLMFVAALINYLDRGSLSIALPLISADLNFSPEAQGLLLSAFFWSYTLMQIPIGWAVDRFDAKWIYAGAFTVWSTACGFTGLASSFGVLVAVRIVLGLGESAYFPSSTKIVSQMFPPKDRGFPTGLFECGTAFGLAAGSVVTAYLAQEFGWRTMFFVVGFSGLLWLIPWLLFIPNRREPTPSGVDASVLVGKKKKPVTFNRNLIGICIGFFCYNYRWYLLMTWLPTYLVQERHMNVLGAGIMASLPYWLYATLQPVGGWLGDLLIRRGFDESKVRKRLVAFGCFCGLLILPVPLVPTVPMAIALLMMSSLTGLAVANMLVIQQRCAPPSEVGIWAGIMNFSGNLAGIAAPFVTGLLVARTGSYLVAFMVGALAMVPGILAYLFIIQQVAPPESTEGFPGQPAVSIGR